MTGTITQPPRPDPALRTPAGRRTLVGKHLNAALEATRGYAVDVAYVEGRRRPRLHKRGRNHLVFIVDQATNIVRAVK